MFLQLSGQLLLALRSQRAAQMVSEGCQGAIFAPCSCVAVAMLSVLAVIRTAATAATVWDRLLLVHVPGVSMREHCAGSAFVDCMMVR